MRLQTYRELIKMAKEKIDDILAPSRVRQMEKQAELQLAQLEEQELQFELKITELTTKYPIPYEQVLDTIDELDLLKHRMEKFNELKDQLFPSSR
jgi:hypothetical protein